MMQEKVQILVVEDLKSNSDLVCAALEDTGEIEAIPLFSGEEALEYLETQHPHMILSDIIMPGISGFDLCSQLKENPRLKDIPVVFVTGKDDATDIVHGLNLGAVDYVTKPIIPEVLVARVRAHLALSFHKEQLKVMANTDALTGLYNRKAFEGFLSEFIENKKEFALIYLDLDRFKPVNDELGHPIGDLLLKRVAKRLRYVVRAVDIVARIGGDEFVVIISKVHSQAIVEMVCDKILKNLAAPYNIDDHEICISATVGAVLYPLDADNEYDLVRYADTAMYHAKESGRNRFTLFEAKLESIVSEKQKMEEELKQGLEKNQFELYYLPSIALSDGTVQSMETLLRWKHPQRGVLSPSQFLEHFILSHLEEKLFVCVIEKVVQQIKLWHQKGILDAHLTLNLTHAEFINRNLMRHITEACRKAECPPQLARWIELDVSESYLMSDIDFSRKQIQELAKIGVTVSLDNFGSSCFSIYELQSMPLSQIKIDRNLISGIGNPSSEQALMTVIHMITSLGHTPAAIGVETEEQQTFLKQHGCMIMQGYRFSTVLNTEEAECLMTEKKSLC
ncbi:MAG: EAL domain-containing protein [Gammaproteobacteria bacterium]|jgi:diguanylate cyclase (GGDEF)-like protein|nr:EAL domain-containing protein [Gammaproteobacteria bacterium]MBT5635275.1 EAL domain-containing protein [Gammaproteobacteria bacterium]